MSGAARLRLYGPDTRYGAKQRPGFKSYVWYIVWREDGRYRERPTGFAHEQIAQAEEELGRWLQANAHRHQDTPERPRDPDEILIADVLRIYAEEHAPQTADPGRIGQLNEALLDWWKEARLSAVTSKSCKRYAEARRQQGRAEATIRRELGNLVAAGNYCVREQYLTRMPPVWRPEKPEPRDRWLKREEIARLLRAARRANDPGHRQTWRASRWSQPAKSKHLPLFILISLYTAARRDAVLSLQWQPSTSGGWVDLDRKLIFWRPQTQKQTKKARPKVQPIPRRLLPFLSAARSRTRQYVIEYNGLPVKDISRSFGTACRIAGLEGHVTPHTLKHTAVTLLLMSGEDIYLVSKLVGTSPQTLLEVYGHHCPEYLRQVADSPRRPRIAG